MCSQMLEQFFGRVMSLAAVAFTAVHPVADVWARAVGISRCRRFVGLQKLGVTRWEARGHQGGHQLGIINSGRTGGIATVGVTANPTA